MEPTPPAKPPRQSAVERRASLLQSALDLFSTQGYAGTTTKAIAERCGVTEAILFRHFRSKEELLRGVVAAFGPAQLFAPPTPAMHAAPVRLALEAMLTQYLDLFWENRPFLQMMFQAPKSEGAVFAPFWDEFSRQALYLYTFLHERTDRGELRADVAAPATDVIAAATGGFLVRVLGDPPSDWNAARTAFVANLVLIVLGGIARSE